MPRCPSCGTFNPIHLDRCERCGHRLVPFALDERNGIRERDETTATEKGRSQVPLLIKVGIIALILVIALVAMNLLLDQGQEEEMATLNLVVFSTVDTNYSVAIYVNGGHIGTVDLPAFGMVEIAYKVDAGSGGTISSMAVFSNDGMEEYRGYYVLDVEAGLTYDVPLYTEFGTN